MLTARGGHVNGPGPFLNLRFLARPSHNAPLAPIEYIFGLVEQQLKQHQWDIDDANFYATLHTAISISTLLILLLGGPALHRPAAGGPAGGGGSLPRLGTRY